MCRLIRSPADWIKVKLPTPWAVLQELKTGDYYQPYPDYYLQHGGRVDFAVEGILHETRESELFFMRFEDGECEAELEEYEAVPEHPFDDEWGFARTMILGGGSS
jgi:hypothetical protein